MSDDKKTGKAEGNNRNRRRYFRRKGAQQPPSEVPAARAPSPAGRSEQRKEARAESSSTADQRSRSANRRRRRSKSRRAVADLRPEPMIAPSDSNDDFSLPASVFIYTYTVRPDTRESYEFRSEHFSKVGRTLEDYKIDLSALSRPEESAASRVAAAFANIDFGDETNDEVA